MSDWISLSLAIATLFGVIVALVFGLRSIRENRVLQVIRYNIELLERLSNWLANVQACIAEDFMPEDFISVQKTGPSHDKLKELLLINWYRRKKALFKVIEEGKEVLGIAYILGEDIKEADKSLMDDLQRTAETFMKYSITLDKNSKEDEVMKISEAFDKEYFESRKSLNESSAKLGSKIFETRISLFDCYLSGSDPFRDR